jgi:hypothetical protein
MASGAGRARAQVVVTVFDVIHPSIYVSLLRPDLLLTRYSLFRVESPIIWVASRSGNHSAVAYRLDVGYNNHVHGSLQLSFVRVAPFALKLGQN